MAGAKWGVLKALRMSALLLASTVAGCSGLEPYEPRDDREEGLQAGLFTGAEGEWVISRGEIKKRQK